MCNAQANAEADGNEDCGACIRRELLEGVHGADLLSVIMRPPGRDLLCLGIFLSVRYCILRLIVKFVSWLPLHLVQISKPEIVIDVVSGWIGIHRLFCIDHLISHCLKMCDC